MKIVRKRVVFWTGTVGLRNLVKREMAYESWLSEKWMQKLAKQGMAYQS